MKEQGRNSQSGPASGIADDLKSLRRGQGLTLSAMAKRPALIRRLSDANLGMNQAWSVADAHGLLRDLLARLGESRKVMALRHAYAIPSFKDADGSLIHPAETLTKRREQLARATGLHTDTIENYENDAIKELELVIESDAPADKYQSLATDDISDTVVSLSSSHQTPSMDPTQNQNSLQSTVVCYSTKFAMPDVYLFWNNLFTLAQRRFYLVGKTNKSWVSKSTDQSTSLGQSIIRILENGGQVKLLSHDEPQIVDSTVAFFAQFVINAAGSSDGVNETVGRAIKEDNLLYAVVPHSNYDAVVSDDKIVFLPMPNSGQFRDEALVLEITRADAYHPFTNYLADIDRSISTGRKISLLNN